MPRCVSLPEIFKNFDVVLRDLHRPRDRPADDDRLIAVAEQRSDRAVVADAAFGDSFPPRGSLFVYFVTFYDGPRGNFFRMLFAFRASKGSLFFCLSAKPLLPRGRRGIFWIQKCPDAIMRRGKKRSGFIR